MSDYLSLYLNFYVRWFRKGSDDKMSLIHIAERSYHDTVGRTACGMTYPLADIVPGPHFAVFDEDGNPDPEDRLCNRCYLAVGKHVGDAI